MTALTRRSFLSGSAIATGALLLPRRAAAAARRRRDMRVAFVGVGNRGSSNLSALAGHGVDVVALCDVDERYLREASSRHPTAATFIDFRAMLAALRRLDAVVVSTADHTHAVAAAAALRRGLDVYCEKPLTHSVYEARRLAALAAEHGAVTQMGTQIHGWPNYHQVVDLLQRGAIGTVTEAHAFCGKAWAGTELPDDTPPVPDGLHWDLWLGPAPEHPYHPELHPASWRRWWPFGNGTLGDMACHYLDLVCWALELGHCTRVRAEGPQPDPVATPEWLRVEWEMPRRGGQPPVRMTWSDGTAKPPELAEIGREDWGAGVLFVGDRGWLLTDYTERELGPEERFAGGPPTSEVEGEDHHLQWVRACRGEDETSCPFSRSGPLTETVLLGAVAHRLGNRSLRWDAKALGCPDTPEAASLLRRAYRAGWSL